MEPFKPWVVTREQYEGIVSNQIDAETKNRIRANLHSKHPNPDIITIKLPQDKNP